MPSFRTLLSGVIPLVLCATSGRAQDGRAQDPWDAVAHVLQTAPIPMEGYVRFALPRGDVPLQMGDVRVAGPLALGGWVGFAGTPGEATMMGDLVVTAEELSRVEAALVGGPVRIEAVHNHLVGERPAMAYVHVHAMGDAAAIARALDAAVRATATVRPVRPGAPGPFGIDTAMANAILGATARGGGAVAQYGFRLVADTVRQHGRVVVPSLALASPVNLQAVSSSRWVASGDFAVTASRVAPLVEALVRHGITITAEHSHLVGEVPAVTYLHFWADGAPRAVAEGLRAALDAARGRD